MFYVFLGIFAQLDLQEYIFEKTSPVPYRSFLNINAKYKFKLLVNYCSSLVKLNAKIGGLYLSPDFAIGSSKNFVHQAMCRYGTGILEKALNVFNIPLVLT